MKLWDVSGEGTPWSVELDLMSGILMDTSTSLGEPEPVLHLGGSRTLRMGFLRFLRCP